MEHNVSQVLTPGSAALPKPYRSAAAVNTAWSKAVWPI